MSWHLVINVPCC